VIVTLGGALTLRSEIVLRRRVAGVGSGVCASSRRSPSTDTSILTLDGVVASGT